MRKVPENVANIQSTYSKHEMSHVVGLLDQIACDASLRTHGSAKPKGPYGLHLVGHFGSDGQKEMGQAREVGPPIQDSFMVSISEPTMLDFPIEKAASP